MENKVENKIKRPHSLQIDGRKKAVLTGIDEVVSMTETLAQLRTSAGGLAVAGKNMHMNKYNAEEGLLVIEGDIDKAAYTADGEKGGFFKKMFK